MQDQIILSQLATQDSNIHPQNEIIFTPPTIDAEVEIGNPMKGFHQWIGSPFLSSLPKYNTYWRFSWRELETSKGVYDFSPIEEQMNLLEEGQRFAFRVMPLNTCCTPYLTGGDVPEYVKDENRGFSYPFESMQGSDSIFIPDWNDTTLLGYMESFIDTLGTIYDGDPRIAWIDIGFYGNWGEWHTYPIQYPNNDGEYETPPPNSSFIYAPVMADPNNPLQQRFRDGSLDTRLKILHAHTNAFQNTQMILSTADLESFFEALRLDMDKPIGIRRDSWGDPYFNDVTKWQNYEPTEDEWTLFNNRFKIAPFVVENIGSSYLGEETMIDQLENFHATTLAFGNLGTWNELSNDKQEAYLYCGRRTGYRYQITNISASLTGSNLTITLSWKNSGIAPSYDHWEMQVYVADPESGNIFSPIIESEIDLNSLFDESVAPIKSNINISLNSGWENQEFLQVRMIIKDKDSYLLPMNIDLDEKNNDGSYTLFSIAENGLTHSPKLIEVVDLIIFPNPVSEKLEIIIPENYNSSIIISNMAGIILQQKINNFENSQVILDVLDYPTGLYSILVQNKNKLYHARFLKL